MKCIHCGSSCIKKGFQKNGKQKYRCSDCCKYQQANYTYKAYEVGLNEQITRLVKRSCGIRDIAYIKDISTTTVMSRGSRIRLSPGIILIKKSLIFSDFFISINFRMDDKLYGS